MVDSRYRPVWTQSASTRARVTRLRLALAMAGPRVMVQPRSPGHHVDSVDTV